MREFAPQSQIDIVVELGINEWNGVKNIQVRMVDLRPSEAVNNIVDKSEKQLAENN